MEVRIGAVGDEGVLELAALLQWLRAERQLSGLVQPAFRTAGPEDLSGGVLDVVSVAVGSGGVAVALAQSLTTWLKGRRAAVKFTITLPGGATCHLETAESAVAAPIIEEMLRRADSGRE
ncbi:hypothetical protein BX264_4988 [Streptomyces sp. 2333.5]|uniref:effector-associated constant component EACC1 n=1 Tax=unclassified Streptomyces TaxID=2593676 RepID=UPI00089840B6|nr:MULTISPECIES: hypothetical protein [unclassified Streptomyces]PJJ04579.1 hypothetical protein BX264_4988 [Streptomyces sp. 2333.5]SEE55229.1 hypothetical protein SAMN05428943_5098 [Streptomyces sp. 2314.4]SEE82030.1 hypothetical protein SAMN05428942_5089 [Streptomyces sp. 2112.2]